MQTKTSWYVKAEDGKTLMVAGKNIGTAVWFAVGITIDNVENIGFKEERPILFADDGKVLEHKETKEQFESIWLKDGDSSENYIEVEPKETQE